MDNEHRPTEVNDVAPTSVAHIIGQRPVVEQVKVGIDAAFSDNRRFDHALLVGPPGMGKSALANVIAAEMATDFHEVLGQSLSSTADLNGLLLQATDKAVIHVDEAHELPKATQTALYLALDKRKVFVNGARSVQSIPIADFSLLLSTTDEYQLLQPLRDRMRLVLRFDFYSEVELVKLIHQRTRALAWDVHEQLFPMIAQRAKGTPRLALRLLQSAHRVARSEGEETIIHDHLLRACALEQIDDVGLGPTEQAYLRLLANGPLRLNVIATTMNLPARTISQVTEAFLIRAGLVTKDDQSRRTLTEKGYEHLSKNRHHAAHSPEN
jgi:Holliday junction DNA helicase RuvB